jgi:hypothetical protein
MHGQKKNTKINNIRHVTTRHNEGVKTGFVHGLKQIIWYEPQQKMDTKIIDGPSSSE